MTRYAVGDLQGCLAPLECLLNDVNFDRNKDQLWLVGDLINRGPQSLETLRFIKELGNCTRIVLGNHDLHFLAIHYGVMAPGKSDTFDELLAADDRNELAQWLLQQPLMYSDPSNDFHMTHAGIPHIWSIKKAKALATEVHQALTGNTPITFFQNMYGNTPNRWSDELSGSIRLRVITNYFARMRYCTVDGTLDFDNKLSTFNERTALADPPIFSPWFSFAQQSHSPENLIFGHWAALQGKTRTDNVFALDTGCVWGRSMTLMNLETKILHSCDCES